MRMYDQGLNRAKMEPNYFQSIIFMKAGPHSGYTLDEIYRMKKKEEKVYGKFFWGYSGVFCHPLRVVAFVKQSLRDYGVVPVLIMTTTPSKYVSASIGKIKEYSVDGETYVPLPKKVLLKGCEYAVIGKNLQQVDFALDLNRYEVVSGKSSGKLLGEYVKYRINKACAIISSAASSSRIIRISYVSVLTSPYCVFLR